MPRKKTTRRKKLTSLERQIADLKDQLPGAQDWRSTDEQEIARRKLRALENPPSIRNTEPSRRIHSAFDVTSFDSGRSYRVEIIDLSRRLFSRPPRTSPPPAWAPASTRRACSSTCENAFRDSTPKPSDMVRHTPSSS